MKSTGIILFCSCLLSILTISSAADTIVANQTISDGETIISSRGGFEMGFFSPGSSSYRYFGIWYKKISYGTVVWVANRDNPIASTLGIIKVSSMGIVVSTNESPDRVIWSSNYSRSVNNPVAQLLDTGNLVFRDYGSCGTNGVCNVNKSPRICTCLNGFHTDITEDWDPARSNGCSRKVNLTCGNGDGFLKYAGLKLPDTRWSWYNISMNLLECEAKCLKDCNCTAYSNTDIRNGGSGCLLWFGGLIDIQTYSEDGQDLYVRLAASELIDNQQKKQLLIKLVPALVVLTAMISFFLWYACKTKRLKIAGKAKLNARHSLDLPLFNFIQIANATENFSDNNKLGKGGFGT